MATLKQKKAFAEVGVNGGNISKAMKVAGYSKEVAKRTDKLTNTKGWKELMEEYLPKKLLAKRHQELLNKREVATAFDHESGERLKVVVDQPDTQAVSKALDMAYKLGGDYAPEKSLEVKVNINPQNPKALAIAKEYEEKLKQEL